MEELIKQYLENSDPDTELEVRFGTKGKKITKINYDNVIKKLKSIGFELAENYSEERLRIMIDGKRVRCDINGIDSISNYCKNDDIKKVKTVNYKFIEKRYIRNSDGTEVKPVDNSEFNFRVSYQSEKLIATDLYDEIVSDWKTQKKTFRFINRISFIHPDIPYVKFDLTVVKTSTKKGGFYVPEFNIESSNVFNNPENYEIEIELLHTDDTIENVIKNMKKSIKHVLCGLQETNYPITESEQLQVLYNYKSLINNKKYLEPKKFTDSEYNEAKALQRDSRNFIGPNQITLQFSNIMKQNAGQVDNINNNYTVTEKADGLRKLMYINNEGKAYFITSNLEVQYTGMKATFKEAFNTLLDGEHILYDKLKNYINLYAIFDVYFIQKVDKRAVPLFSETVDSRYSQLSDYVSSIYKKPEYFVNVVGNIKNSLKIQAKTFYGNKSQTIFQACKQIMEYINEGLFPYETDGLIFTPASLGVGQESSGDLIVNKKKTWKKCFKWKPPEFNTVDFLISTIKTSTGKDEVKDYIEEGISSETIQEIQQYKTIKLIVGYSEKYFNPLQNLIDDNLVVRNDFKEYKPVPFYPTDPIDNDTHLCKILLKRDKGGTLQMMTEDGEVFNDKTIVEFKYVLDNGKGWRWVPIKVRNDKTAKYLAGEKEYGNSYEVANSNWKTIHNPITENMLITGDNIPDNVDTSVYYNRSNDISKTKPMRNFHNLYVKNTLIGSVSNPGNTLIDYAVGKAGDLNKWTNAKLSFVFGVDYSSDNIENKQDGACVRYIESKAKSRNVPNALFAVGNSALNYKQGQGLKTDRDKMIYNAVIGRGSKSEKQLGKGVFKHFGKGQNGFNVSSCQFALHYFFEDLTSVKGILKNVSENTAVGGYFIGTCYDGNKLFSKLEDLKKGESYTVYKEDTVILEITKQYENTEFNNDDTSLGYGIDVLQETINMKWREYLVNFNYLVRLMENFGFKVLDKAECEEKELPASVGNFNMLFNKMEDEMLANPKLKYGDSNKISDEEKEISFLNKFFIFKKIRNVDTQNINLNVTETPIDTALVDLEEEEPVTSVKPDTSSKTYDDGYKEAYDKYDEIFKNGYDNIINEMDGEPSELIKDPKNPYENGYNDAVNEIYSEGKAEADAEMGGGNKKNKFKLKKKK